MRVLSVIRNTRIVFFSISMIIMIMICGCKKQKVDLQEMVDQTLHDALASLAKKTELPSDIINRAKTALTKLENGSLDTEPILLMAAIGISDLNNQPQADIDIIYFDENNDLRGLRIKEHYIDSNGLTTSLEEDYPVFVNTLNTPFTNSAYFPVHFRDKNQRKDEYLWLEYVNRNLDGLIRLNIDERQSDTLDTHLKNLPFEKMPPIYISIPDPNKVQVEISVYDREGNESDRIELHVGLSMEIYNTMKITRDGGA